MIVSIARRGAGSRRRDRVRAGFVVLAGILMSIARPVHANAWTLADLMDELSNLSQMEATFTEHRTSLFLKRPLQLRGRIVYRAPDYIEKTVESPFDERILIESDRIVVDQGMGQGKIESAEIRRYDLDSHPAIRDAVEGVHAALGGDMDKLASQFATGFEGDRSSWTLRLTPRNARVRDHIDAIVIAGSGVLVQSIRTLEDNGDESLIELEQVSVDHKVSEGGDPAG
jgi:hypothetical protein